MRQPMMGGAQAGMVPGAGLGSIPPSGQATMMPQAIPTDHQNGKNNVQLDPFGAFQTIIVTLIKIKKKKKDMGWEPIMYAQTTTFKL